VRFSLISDFWRTRARYAVAARTIEYATLYHEQIQALGEVVSIKRPEKRFGIRRILISVPYDAHVQPPYPKPEDSAFNLPLTSKDK
jgi:hypothetical protein